jgi:hypothetical protein
MKKMRTKYSLSVLFSFILPFIAIGQPVGEIYTVGYTYIDLQHEGSVDRTVAIDGWGNAHFCWSEGNYVPSIRFNFFNSTNNNFNWIGGLNFSDMNQSITGSIGLLNSGRSVICYKGTTVLEEVYITFAVDQIYSAGAFLEHFVPNNGMYFEQPRLAVDSRNWLHALAYSQRVGNIRALYYNRSENNGLSWLTEWTFVDSVRVTSAALAASSTGKVTLIWSHPINPVFISPLENLNNDIYLAESNDGETWDFTNPVNITDFANGVHPKSDSIRAYEDLSLLYDSGAQLHIVYTCAGYWISGGHSNTCPGSLIYHFSPNTGFSQISGELAFGLYPSSSRRYYDRPSLGYYQSEQELYCIWDQFADISDTSSTGRLNGEIYGAYSVDMGESWSSAVNLSNTPSPGDTAGECQSEDYPSLAAVVNDTLHISYLLDREPGAINTFQNDIKYQKIPVQEFKDLVGVTPQPPLKPPSDFAILSVYPNPFNQSIDIRFEMRDASPIELKIYDVFGREVAAFDTRHLTLGENKVTWETEGMPSGVYFVRLTANSYQLSADGGQSLVRKVVLLK